MQGKILGFSGDEGAITAEDGARFTFSRGDWKSEGEPRPGTTVDFVAGADGKAQEIYSLKPAGPDVGAALARGGEEFSKLASSEGSARAIALARARPEVPLAILLLIVAFLFSYAVTGTGNWSEGDSLVGFMGEIGDGLEQNADAAEQLANAFFMDTGRANEYRGMLMMSDMMLWLGYLLLAVPLLAGLLIWRAWSGKPTRLIELFLAIACICSFLYFFVLRAMNAALLDEVLGQSGDVYRENFNLGLGGWLLLLIGLAFGAKAIGIWKTGGGDAPAAAPPASSTMTPDEPAE